jgi:preprotein translocase subunit SecD
MINIPRWQQILVALVLVFGVLYALPNVLPRSLTEDLPSWGPNEQINLGLDLRGGSYLLLEVQMDEVIKEQLESLVDGVRLALREDRIGYTGLGIENGQVTFTLRDPSQEQRVRDLLLDLAFGYDMTVEEGRFVLTPQEDAIQQRRVSILNQSIEIVRRRIDETGTREPVIQQQGEERILVQLPGIDDPERIKAILGRTARMNFRLVHDDLVPGRDRVPRCWRAIPRFPAVRRSSTSCANASWSAARP